jgi:hypothetical protein
VSTAPGTGEGRGGQHVRARAVAAGNEGPAKADREKHHQWDGHQDAGTAAAKAIVEVKANLTQRRAASAARSTPSVIATATTTAQSGRWDLRTVEG